MEKCMTFLCPKQLKRLEEKISGNPQNPDVIFYHFPSGHLHFNSQVKNFIAHPFDKFPASLVVSDKLVNLSTKQCWIITD